MLILAPADMLIHCAAHVIADGDLSGGLRNLWDCHVLLKRTDVAALEERSRHHGLDAVVARAIRLADCLYGARQSRMSAADRLFLRALTARDDWGRTTRRFTRLMYTIRSHWLRMPPLMLARHLWVKWRRGN